MTPDGAGHSNRKSDFIGAVQGQSHFPGEVIEIRAYPLEEVELYF